MVYSRPIWSDSQPKKGRPTPSKMRLSETAKIPAAMVIPNRSTGTLSSLRSMAIGFTEAVMDRPPAAISTNMMYST